MRWIFWILFWHVLGIIPFAGNRPISKGQSLGVSNRYMLAPQKSVYLRKRLDVC